MTISQRFLPVDFDHHSFSLVPKPYLPVWVCPMISLKTRLSLALLMVSLTFHFFPIFNVGFSDFITSSFESSSIILCLIFLDLNSSPIDLNGNFTFACLQYKATSDNHFWIYLFILASIDSTVLVTILYISSGPNNIRINIWCWPQTLNFPYKGQWSILWRPCNVLYVTFAWFIHPKLFTSSSDTVGILWPPTLKFIFWFTFLFLTERLLDFLGFNFILHQIICLLIKLSILWIVDSWMRGLYCHPWMPSLMAFETLHQVQQYQRWSLSLSKAAALLEQKVLVTLNIPSQFQLQCCSN